MDKQISGREEKVRTQALTHMQMYRVIKAPLESVIAKVMRVILRINGQSSFGLIFSSFDTVISSPPFFFWCAGSSWWVLEPTGIIVAACGLSCSVGCGILVPQPGIEPTSPELQGGFLTTGPSDIVLVAQSCLTLCDPMDCSQPGSSSMDFSRQEHWSG